VERWVELSRDEQARLMKDIRESQKKLAENVRMSQQLVSGAGPRCGPAAVPGKGRRAPGAREAERVATSLYPHPFPPTPSPAPQVAFQGDEAFANQRSQEAAAFLRAQQEAEWEALKGRLERAAAGKRRRLDAKVAAKTQRCDEKRGEAEAAFLLAERSRTQAFRRMLRFMRSQQEARAAHAADGHRAAARQLLEAQEVEARHQRLAQELQARQLPRDMQPTFLRVCETAARQLREVQAARARQLIDVQGMEQLHALANFERGLRMAEDRTLLEAAFAGDEFALAQRHRREVDDESLRIVRRAADLKLLQAGEKHAAEERALRAVQRKKLEASDRRRRAAERQGESRRRRRWVLLGGCARR
jgi:hypothetical protein